MSEPIGDLAKLSVSINRLADAIFATAGNVQTSKAPEKEQKSPEPTGTTADSSAKKTSTTKTTRNKKADDKVEPVRSKQEALDAIVALKNAKGTEDAKALLQKHGFNKLADITPEKFDVLYDDATALLEDSTDPDAPEDDEI